MLTKKVNIKDFASNEFKEMLQNIRDDNASEEEEEEEEEDPEEEYGGYEPYKHGYGGNISTVDFRYVMIGFDKRIKIYPV